MPLNSSENRKLIHKSHYQKAHHTQNVRKAAYEKAETSQEISSQGVRGNYWNWAAKSVSGWLCNAMMNLWKKS